MQAFTSLLKQLVEAGDALEGQDSLPGGLQAIVTLLTRTVDAGDEQIEKLMKQMQISAAAAAAPPAQPVSPTSPAPTMRSLGAEEALPVMHRSLAEVQYTGLSAASSAPGGTLEAFTSTAFAEQGTVAETLAADLEELFAAELPAALQPAVRELREMLLGC